MLGAIIGDIAGSRFEFNNTHSTDFDLFGDGCAYTDDTICTLAVAFAILQNKPFDLTLHQFGNTYVPQSGGYGGMFYQWLHSRDPKPYNSFGNGSAMRVSPCALLAKDNKQALKFARQSAECTHNHPEGIKGAVATCDAIRMAMEHISKDEIRSHLENEYGYNLQFRCNDINNQNLIKNGYICNDETCQTTVPQAFVAFLDGNDFESSIKLSISLGGDSDTIAAICGPIAEAYYGIPTHIKERASEYLPLALFKILDAEYCRYYEML